MTLSISTSSIPQTPFRSAHSLLYTSISLLLTTLIFYQPYSTRQHIWQHYVLDTAEHYLPNDPERQKFYIVIVGGLMVHTVVFVTLNLAMFVIYSMEHPYFEQFKIQKQREWPWNGSEEERERYYTLVRKSIIQILINDYIVAPALALSNWKNSKNYIDVDMSTLPHWYTSVWHIIVFMIIEDTMFYWAHRALHHPRIYGYIHKRHHEYKTPIGISSEYAHPIEFIFSNAIPFTIGPQLLHTHCYTFYLWYVWRIGETVDGHSGYEFPWIPYRLLPFSGSATFHDFHHSRNVGNYSSFFTWWDRLMSTHRYYPQYMDKIEAQYQVHHQHSGNGSEVDDGTTKQIGESDDEGQNGTAKKVM